MVASRRLALPSAAAASSHCRRRVGYSLPVSVCRTLELVMRTAKLVSVSGTRMVSRDLQQELSTGRAPAPPPAPAIGRPSDVAGSSCLRRCKVHRV